jgi:hypothetical protein
VDEANANTEESLDISARVKNSRNEVSDIIIIFDVMASIKKQSSVVFCIQ